MVSSIEVFDFLAPRVLHHSRATQVDNLWPASVLGTEVENSVVFCSVSVERSHPAILERGEAFGFVIAEESDQEILARAKNWVVVESPRLEFVRLCRRYFLRRNGSVLDERHSVAGYSRSAHRFDRLGHGGHFFGDVEVGDGTYIGPGSVVGADGFGIEWDEITGEVLRFPHYGGVRIGSNCEIGSNVVIDRGTFSHTTICDSVAIDSGVHVAHNAWIGSHTEIASGARILGSARIGRGVRVGSGAIVRDGVEVGDSCRIGMGAIVTRNLPDFSRVFGNPAREIPNYEGEPGRHNSAGESTI